MSTRQHKSLARQHLTLALGLGLAVGCGGDSETLPDAGPTADAGPDATPPPDANPTGNVTAHLLDLDELPASVVVHNAAGMQISVTPLDPSGTAVVEVEQGGTVSLMKSNAAATAGGFIGYVVTVREVKPGDELFWLAPFVSTAACKSRRFSGSIGFASWLGKVPSSSK